LAAAEARVVAAAVLAAAVAVVVVEVVEDAADKEVSGVGFQVSKM
jgi:hypothetical protein